MPAYLGGEKCDSSDLSQPVNTSYQQEHHVNDTYLFEDTVGEQKKRAVVAVGRMNPPTLGHYKVIDAMKEFIRKNADLKLDATPIVVIVEGKETSKDRSKNPLTGEERKSFMESSGRANGVRFLVAPSAFAAFEEVRKAGFEPIAVAAGSDRAPKYIDLLDKYFKTKKDAAIKHHAVPGLERDIDNDTDDGPDAFARILQDIDDGSSIPLSMISGSLARYAAKQDNLKAFAYITGLSKKQALAKKLMSKVKAGQGETE